MAAAACRSRGAGRHARLTAVRGQRRDRCRGSAKIPGDGRVGSDHPPRAVRPPRGRLVPRDMAGGCTSWRARTRYRHLLPAGGGGALPLAPHRRRRGVAFLRGRPLRLELSSDAISTDRVVLGAALAEGQHPQHVVPARTWQSARSLGRWSLVGCTVSPAFDFAGFELASPHWRPGQ